jgi:carbonic anhydrase
MKTNSHRAFACVGVAFLAAMVSFGPVGIARGAAAQEAAPHWDYEEHGPATWGKLSPDYVACAEGHSQSPIDITNAEVSSAPAIRASYKPASLRIVHNIHSADVVNTGHSVQVNFPQGDSLTIGDSTYSLVQFHFHGPSEHTVNGRHFPMEMHLVHMSADKKLAVVGVLIEEGRFNKAYQPIFTNLPNRRGVETHLEHVTVDVQLLLPRNTSSWRYDGSLTTPPCSEGVKWIVLKEPVQLSAEQIKAFGAVVWNNSRPVQALHGRKVVLDHIKEN